MAKFGGSKKVLLMKHFVKYILQKLLGFSNYLFVFSVFTIYKLKWDKNEKDFMHFLSLLPNQGLVLDIGANIGIMSVHLARKLDKAEVLAFEPIPDNLKALRRIAKFFKLKNIRIFDIALGDENGEVTMVMPVIDNVKMQGLSHVVHESISENNDGKKVSVPLVKLDDMKELNGTKKVEGIKIDVENFEYFVLKGGEKMLKTHKPVVYCELWDNENRYNCIDLMKRLNYNTMILSDGKLEKFEKEKYQSQNFFFIPVKEAL